MVVRPFVLNSCLGRTDEPLDATRITDGDFGLDDNTGNGYITYCLSRVVFGRLVDFPQIRNMFMTDLDAIDVGPIRQGGCTHLFIVFQSHVAEFAFGYDWARLERFVQRVDLPVVVFSLGAISPNHREDHELHTKVPPDMLHCLKAIADRSVSLSVRGEYSASVLDGLGIRNVRMVGCPTYFENGPGRRIALEEWSDERGVLATGWFSNAGCSDRLHFVFQDPYQDAPFYKGSIRGYELTDADLASLGVPVYDQYISDSWRAFVEGRTSVFADYEVWKELIRGRFNLAIGTRLHGGIAAINSGVPAIVTNGDPRAREMATLFGIPYMPHLWGNSTALDLRALREETDFSPLNDHYDALYANYVDWLAENGVVTSNDGARSIEGGHLDLRSEVERMRFALDCARRIMRVRDARIAELENHVRAIERGFHDEERMRIAYQARVEELSAEIEALRKEAATAEAPSEATPPKEITP